MATNQSSVFDQAPLERYLHQFPLLVGSIYYISSGPGPVTWFGQWDSSKYNSSRGCWEFFCYCMN